jgi:hypothetical protein
MPAQRLSVSEQFASTQIKKKHAEIFRKEAFQVYKRLPPYLHYHLKPELVEVYCHYNRRKGQ